jgi:hypothetical protein
MRVLIATAALIALSMTSTGSQAFTANEEQRQLDLSGLVEAVEPIVHRYYPEARVSLRDERTIEIEHDAQMFMVHLPTKTGEWQEASPIKGPRRGGVVMIISIRDGEWQGAAVLPQSFDHCYFVDHVSLYHSETLDAHAHVSLRYEGAYPSDLMTELARPLSELDRHIH